MGGRRMWRALLPSFLLYLATPPLAAAADAAAAVVAATLALLHFPPLSLIAIRSPLSLTLRIPFGRIRYVCLRVLRNCHPATAKKKSLRGEEIQERRGRDRLVT